MVNRVGRGDERRKRRGRESRAAKEAATTTSGEVGGDGWEKEKGEGAREMGGRKRTEERDGRVRDGWVRKEGINLCHGLKGHRTATVGSPKRRPLDCDEMGKSCETRISLFEDGDKESVVGMIIQINSSTPEATVRSELL
ncbi:hypothetical protein Droror1_Dr00028012 [Drosera rotundifolia]